MLVPCGHMKLPRFVLILPDIRSCHNVGAMFRTADACGVEKIWLCGYTPVPPRPEIDKVALGAETWMPWEQAADPTEVVRKLKLDGYTIVALEKNGGSVAIGDMQLQAPVALIVGNEVTGVGEELLDLADIVAHIPMCGRKESLNVSVAAGIGMYVVGQKL